MSEDKVSTLLSDVSVEGDIVDYYLIHLDYISFNRDIW